MILSNLFEREGENMATSRIESDIVNKTKIGSIEGLLEKGFKERNIYELYNDKEFGSDWTYKLDFLSTFIYENYSTSMFAQYITIFKKSKDIEEYFKKDLYDFSEDQVLRLLKTFRSKTYNSVTNKYSLIKTYMEIAKGNNKGLVTVPTGMLLTASKIQETICNFAQEIRYCTRTELEEAVEKLTNPADKVIFLLLFEGVAGNRYSDLLNLKVEDVNLEERYLITPSNKRVEFSSYTAKVLKESFEEDTYYKFGNGADYKLDMSSPYVLKGKLTKNSNGNPLKYAGLNRRLDVVKKNMEMETATGGTIYRSGLIERILIEEHKVGKQFTVKETGELLTSWGELKEGGDIRRAIKVAEKSILEDLESRNFIIE